VRAIATSTATNRCRGSCATATSASATCVAVATTMLAIKCTRNDMRHRSPAKSQRRVSATIAGVLASQIEYPGSSQRRIVVTGGGAPFTRTVT
jgi:hypothetical protein